MPLVGPSLAPVRTEGNLTGGIGQIVVAHVQQQAAILQFDHFALVDLMTRGGAAQLPGLTVIIGIDHMRAIMPGASFDVIARNDQAAALGPCWIWIPAPGPVAYHVQLVGLTCWVISRGGDQVSPSSVDR